MEKNGIEIVISVRQLWNPTRQTLQGCCLLVFPLGWGMFWSMVHSPPPLHCFSQILSFVFYLLERFFSFIQSLCPIDVVQSLSRVQLFATPWIAWLPCPSPSPGACSNSCPLSPRCHSAISSSVIPSSSCLQLFPASGSFLRSQLLASGGQSNGASVLASVLSMNNQDWFPLGWTGLISLQSKGLSRVFSNTIIKKHQFFSAQPSLWSNSHIYTWHQKNIALTMQDLCWQSNVSAF